MAFWDLLTVASMPVIKILLISSLGAVLSTQYAGVLTDESRKSLNKVIFVVFTPALMFASLVQSVTFEDLISWWSMPFNIFLTFFFGSILGWIIVKITRPPEYLNGIVVANCCAGNLGNLLIIVVPALCQEQGSPFGEPSACKVRGTAYASFSMALGSIFIWTYAYNLIRSAGRLHEKEELENGLHEKIPNIDYLNAGETSKLLHTVQIIPEVPSSGGDYPSDEQKANGMVVSDSSSEKPSCIQASLRKVKHYMHETATLILEELKAPPTIGVAAGFIVGAIPQVKDLFVGVSSPLRVIQDSIALLGDGTIPGIILVMGGNLVKGLSSSKLRPVIIVMVVCVKLVLLPLIGIFVVKGASSLGLLPEDPMYHFVLMIQYTVPAAMNIGTMAQLFNVGQQECSVLFLWNYLLAAIAITFWSTVYMWILFP